MATKYPNFFIYIFLVDLLIAGCATNAASTIVGSNYDEEKDTTNYFVVPYGSVAIPGKWEKSNYKASSRQQFFVNSDLVTISAAFSSCTQFSFNTDGSKTGYSFVKTYYEWDSMYFVQKHGLERTLIEQDENSNFIVWRLKGTLGGSKVDTHFLFGANDCNVSVFSVTEKEKWTEAQAISFLKNLYVQKQN